ncbi:PAS domain-containing protein, partial [Granulosicoccus sp.]|nr:PAS domain-containing protein [Granulosicoccus sp.]
MTERDTHDKSNAEQRYRSLVDDAPYTIIIVDYDKRVFVEEANRSAEKLYGLKRSDILGKLGPQDLSPEFQPDGRRSDEAALEFMQAALDEKFPTFEWLHRTAQGIDVPCQVTLSRFPD